MLCSELYGLMKDQDDGVKELVLEQEKRVFNHCFTGAVDLGPVTPKDAVFFPAVA